MVQAPGRQAPDVKHADFLILAGTVLPILAIAVILEAAAFEVPSGIARQLRIKIASTALVALEVVPIVLGEVVCLRCLYVGDGPHRIGLELIILGLVFPALTLIVRIIVGIWVT